MGAMAGCGGYLLPGYWLSRCKQRRQRAINRSLPDFLDLIISCVEAGLSFEASIQRVTADLAFAHPLLGQEMLKVQREIDLGATPDRALQSLAERTDSEIVRNLATICHQARKYGTRLSTALKVHADILRDERENLAEEAAQKAAVKILFPTLLCLFPAIFVVLAGPAAIQISEHFTSDQADMAQDPPQKR
jgi:tight adherence protein C